MEEKIEVINSEEEPVKDTIIAVNEEEPEQPDEPEEPEDDKEPDNDDDEDEPEEKEEVKTQQYRSFEGHMKVLSAESPLLKKVEIWLLNNQITRNKSRYENLAEHMLSFVNTPVLVAYVNNGRTVGDGHNFRMKKDMVSGEEHPTFTDATSERIVGWINSPQDIRLEMDDMTGEEWIVANANLWSWYAPELTEMLTLQGEDGMSVSIETLVEDPVIVDGIEVYHGWTVLGTTILGKGVTPAVAGAHIRTCSFEEELNGLKLKVASYQEEQEHKDDTHFTERNIRRMNRKQLEALQARFPEHIVVQASDDGLNVCLLSKDGYYPCVYAFGSADEQTIAPERIEPIAVNAVYGFASGREVSVDLNSILDSMTVGSESLKGQIAALTADKETMQSEIDGYKAELNAMKEAERKRRVQAVKDAAKAALDRFNACQPADEAVDDEMCKQIAEEADNGGYDGCCRNNEWVGDKMAEEKVLAYCATKVAEINKVKAQKMRTQSTFAWDFAKSGNGTGTGIDGMLARVNNK